MEAVLRRQVDGVAVGRERDAVGAVLRHPLRAAVEHHDPLAGRGRAQLHGAKAEYILAREVDRAAVVVGDLAGAEGADKQVRLARATGRGAELGRSGAAGLHVQAVDLLLRLLRQANI